MEFPLKIEIAARFKPFSHQFLARCRLPGGDIAKICPAALEVQGSVHALPAQGPAKGFTTQIDLERGKLQVFGHYKSGYLKEEIDLRPPSPLFERVSFGCHKAQNWEAMHSRRSLEEWLPHWHWLAQWEGDIARPSEASPKTLLHRCQHAGRMELYDALLELFDGAFSDYFVEPPQRWQQMALPFPPSEGQNVLVEGAAVLRHALVRSTTEALLLLPSLPKELVCGRYLHAAVPFGKVDFEWSKGLLRRAILKAAKTGTVQLHFQKDLQTFRLSKEGGGSPLYLTNGAMVLFEENSVYLLDRFEK